MKILRALAFVSLLGMNAIGQAQQDTIVEELVVPLSNPGQTGKLIVNQIHGGIKVIGYSGENVVVIVRQEQLRKKEEKKNGLKKISNSSLNLEIEELDNVVEVDSNSFSRGGRSAVDLEIKVPEKFNLELSNVNDGDTIVIGVNGEMEISNINGNITLDSVSGSAVVDSINGYIKGRFEAVNANSSLAFSSMNKTIDLTFPKNLKANIKAKTERGDIYTGFDVLISKNKPLIEKESSQSSYKLKLEKWVQGTVNGGGSEILFKNHNGDILIRSDD